MKGKKLGLSYLGSTISRMAKSVATIYNVIAQHRSEPIEIPHLEDGAKSYYNRIASSLNVNVSESFLKFFASAKKLFSCASSAASRDATVGSLDEYYSLKFEIIQTTHNPMLSEVVEEEKLSASGKYPKLKIKQDSEMVYNPIVRKAAKGMKSEALAAKGMKSEALAKKKPTKGRKRRHTAPIVHSL